VSGETSASDISSVDFQCSSGITVEFFLIHDKFVFTGNAVLSRFMINSVLELLL